MKKSLSREMDFMKHLNPYFLFLGTAGCLLLAAGLGLCFFAAAKNLLLGAVLGAVGLVCLVLLAVLRRRWCRPAAAARR